MASPTAIFESTGGALGDIISEAFDIPVYGLEDQLAGVSNENTASPQLANESTGSNAYEKDDGLDAALIDLISYF